MGLKTRPEISGQIKTVQKTTGILLAIFIVTGILAALYELEFLMVFLPLCLSAGWAFASALAIKIGHVEGSRVTRREMKKTFIKPVFRRKAKNSNEKAQNEQWPAVKTRREYWAHVRTVHGDQYRIAVSLDDYKKLYQGRTVLLYSLTSKIWCPYMRRVYRQYSLPL